MPVKGEKGGVSAARYELSTPSTALGSANPSKAIARYLEATTGCVKAGAMTCMCVCICLCVRLEFTPRSVVNM